MTYPVYIGDRAAGTMTVTAAGEDHLFEVICHPPEPGLWRGWVQGEGQRLALGRASAPPVFPADHRAAGDHPVGRGGVLRREGLPMAARRAGGLPPAPAAGGYVPPGGAAGAAGRAL